MVVALTVDGAEREMDLGEDMRISHVSPRTRPHPEDGARRVSKDEL